MSLKALLPNLSDEGGVGDMAVPCSDYRESFNYMEFALGWAISIFYVDTLPPQHAFIHSHSQEGALTKNRLYQAAFGAVLLCLSRKRK